MRLVCVMLLFALGCSSPPSKNSVSNSNPNNSSSNNSTPNNSTSNNSSVPNAIWARDFDQTCDWDSECLLVNEGDQCACGGEQCFNASIAVADQEAWYAASDDACPGDPEVCPGMPCSTEQLAACADGTCAVREAVYVDASDWETSCTADSDCAIVHQGEVCSDCVCGGTAVNVSELSKYEELTADVKCAPGPSLCECATVEVAWCDQGTCEPGVNPECVGQDSNGFFGNCDSCGDNCDEIDTNGGSRFACGCETSADCPCGLSCGSYEIAPNVVVSGICVR